MQPHLSNSQLKVKNEHAARCWADCQNTTEICGLSNYPKPAPSSIASHMIKGHEKNGQDHQRLRLQWDGHHINIKWRCFWLDAQLERDHDLVGPMGA